MRTFIKVIRWIVIILAAMTLIGFILKRLTSGDPATTADVGALIFWLIVGAIALYFELKATSSKE